MQSKGNYSAIIEYSQLKLLVHSLIMVIYIQYKFHEIPSIGNLVMAEDGKNYWNLISQRAITLLLLMTPL